MLDQTEEEDCRGGILETAEMPDDRPEDNGT
jgi:hypothetical protein